MTCFVKLFFVGMSMMYVTDDPKFDTKRTNLIACQAVVECGMAPPETKCRTIKPKKPEEEPEKS